MPSEKRVVPRSATTTDDLGQTSTTSQRVIQGLQFIQLPQEIRFQVYRHLFYNKIPGRPIWILRSSHVADSTSSSSPPPAAATGPSKDPDSCPVFHTDLFRVCKAVHHDAITFAYGQNSFYLQGHYSAFCSLGEPAWSSLRNLTIVRVSDPVSAQEKKLECEAWKLVATHCWNLKCLEIELRDDLLLQCLPYLAKFLDQCCGSSSSHSFNTKDRGGGGEGEHLHHHHHHAHHHHHRQRSPPTVVLDLYVWSPQFSFDSERHDFDRAQGFIKGENSSAKARTTRGGNHDPNNSTGVFAYLPPTAETIVLRADTTVGVVSVLDLHLDQRPNWRLRKEARELQDSDRRARGKSNRFQYTWVKSKSNNGSGSSSSPFEGRSSDSLVN